MTLMDDSAAKTDVHSARRPSSSGPVMPARRSPRHLGTHGHTRVLPFDYRWTPGEAIWPCADCLPWHVEVLLDRHEGNVLLREWHSAECSVWDLGSDPYEQDQA